MKRLLLPIAVLVLSSVGESPVLTIRPSFRTAAVTGDADDPAIWVNPKDPARSLIIGTDKKDGALYVFDLDGKKVQVVKGLDQPNNVDVEYGFNLGKRSVDIAVVTERKQRRLRIFAIDPIKRSLSDISGATAVFAGEEGELGAPMGIAMYKRKDGATFAFVSRKEGPTSGYVWQYRLTAAAGRIGLVKVREVGFAEPGAEIESLAVDDRFGYVYLAEEKFGVRKYAADPDSPVAAKELGTFATGTFGGDREGIAVVELGTKGYVICTEQMDGNSRYHVYPRDNQNGEPIAILEGGADATDGIDASSSKLGKFGNGVLVAMNSKDRNFLVYDLGPVLSRLAKSAKP